MHTALKNLWASVAIDAGAVLDRDRSGAGDLTLETSGLRPADRSRPSDLTLAGWGAAACDYMIDFACVSSTTPTWSNDPRWCIPGIAATEAEHAKLAADRASSAPVQGVHRYYPFVVEDRGCLGKSALTVVYIFAVLLAVRNFPGDLEALDASIVIPGMVEMEIGNPQSFSARPRVDVPELLRSLQAGAPGLMVHFPGRVQLKLSRVLGNGSFGVVHSGRVVDSATGRTIHPLPTIGSGPKGGATQLGKGGDDMEVAIKIMRLTMPSRKGGDDSNVATMRNEAIILTQARHENIVQLHAIGATQSTNTSSVFLVQTKINGPSLEDVVQSARGSRGQLLAGKGYRDVDAARWMLGIARGLHYLHSELNILHRDIKLANIRLSSNDTSTSEAVILDFGVSCKRLTINERTRISSSASLNLHRGNCNYDCEAEVYSMGLVMYELFNRSTIENVAGLEGYVGAHLFQR
eukprot:jgi/Tetstr1/427377/TSEL_017541.t1